MIPVVFSTDHNFVMPTGITILSLLTASEFKDYDLYVIISDDVTENDKDLLRRQVEQVSISTKLSFLTIGDDFRNSYEVRGISKACYYRLLIPWLLPKYEKVIYSDTDIIYKIDLDKLYGEKIGNNLFCGVNTPGFRKGSMLKYIKKMRLDPQKYINSGFLIINSKQIREENLYDKFKTLASQRFLFQDQDIINIIGKGRIGLIDDIYNLSPQNAIKTEHCVIHYTGVKPWNNFTYCWMEWWNLYKSSIFYDENLYFEVSSNILSLKCFVRRIFRSLKYNIQKRIR